jgi:hypothetical protein
MHDIFLSYSRRDNEIMQSVKQSFLRAGLSVWTDEGIKVGTASWKKSIQKAILETGCLVCLASPDALESRWVQEELDFAELHEKARYLILIRGEPKTSIPFGFSTHQFADIRKAENYEQELLRLIVAIRQKLGLDTQIPAPSPKPASVDTVSTPPAAKPAPSEEVLSPKSSRAILSYADKLLNPTPSSYPAKNLSRVYDILPAPFDWCEIPTGRVKVSTSSNLEEISGFLIAKYPITNTQFAKFIEEDGYKNKAWWTKAGWQQKEKDNWNEPRFWQASQRREAEHPVTGVSWYESIAFCMWLSGATGEKIMLATHKQWQRAAQGDERQAYPWGMQWDASRCNNNVDKMKLPQTTSVQYFEGRGDSPYKVIDMVGNTWEWCLTESASNVNPLEGTSERVIRGGSMRNTNVEVFRVDFHQGTNADNRNDNIGFRIVCSLD